MLNLKKKFGYLIISLFTSASVLPLWIGLHFLLKFILYFENEFYLMREEAGRSAPSFLYTQVFINGLDIGAVWVMVLLFGWSYAWLVRGSKEKNLS